MWPHTLHVHLRTILYYIIYYYIYVHTCFSGHGLLVMKSSAKDMGNSTWLTQIKP